MMMKDDAMEVWVYERSMQGHRGDYLTVLQNIFSVKLIDGISSRNLITMLLCKRLLFPTCDDNFGIYSIVSVLRSAIGKKTVGIVMRSDTIVEKKALGDLVKYFLLKILRQFVMVKSLSILPFEKSKPVSAICHGWIYDIQLWDLPFISRNQEPQQIGKDVYEANKKTKEKTVIVSLGEQFFYKGITFLLSLAQHCKLNDSTLVWVIAGDCTALGTEIVDALVGAGCIVINRRISNQELFYLYDAADFVWACYEPSYDQSSGIFSRAIQLGKRVIVRANSRIHRMCLSHFTLVECVPLPYDDAVTGCCEIIRYICAVPNNGSDNYQGYSEMGEKRFRAVIGGFFEN
jgi:hypothetical protein